jgi:dihydroorotate dehydrogenase (fumarate)
MALSIPIIGGLNGSTPEGWVRYAKLMESYGASAIELNVYFLATDPQIAGVEVEKRYANLVEDC